MTTELTDEQIREAAMKASRLEVERAPIAFTELTDTELMLRLRRWKVADPADILVVQELTKDIAAAADRLAERNAAIETAACKLESHAHPISHDLACEVAALLRKALSPAQKEAAEAISIPKMIHQPNPHPPTQRRTRNVKRAIPS